MPNSLAKTLIERACINAGSAVELSKMLGVKPQRITQWKNGHLKCQPDDLAAIAAIAGYNALNVLAAATLEATEGTAKGAVLDAALGKAMKATGYASNGGSTPQNSLKDQLIQWAISLNNNNYKQLRMLLMSCIQAINGSHERKNILGNRYCRSSADSVGYMASKERQCAAV